MHFNNLQWLFPIAVALHNAEEAIWMPGWADLHAKWLMRIYLPGKGGQIRVALLTLTGAAFFVTYWSWRKGAGSVQAYLLFGCVVAMLANVFVPHVPATLAFRAYTPGVVTAAAINWPVMSWLAWAAVRDGWVSGWKAVFFAVGVPIGIAVLIVVFFLFGKVFR